MGRFRGRADDAGPDYPDPYISPAVEAAAGALEKHGWPQEDVARVVVLMEELEAAHVPAEPDPPDFICPLCGAGTPDGCMCVLG